MKKGTNLLLVLLLFSCANYVSEESMTVSENYEMLEYAIESTDFTLEKLASEKLYSYFELLKLQNEHPEFKEDILRQLKDFSKEKRFTKMNNPNNFSVENIHKGGEITILSDSVQSMKLYYTITSDNRVETDSVEALITTKTVLLDGMDTKSLKITFSLLN